MMQNKMVAKTLYQPQLSQEMRIILGISRREDFNLEN
jgi:hypothetical protein